MKILITGSSGYIGKRLIPSLLAEGHTLYLLSRRESGPPPSEHLISIKGDLLSTEWADQLPDSLDAAYYLVHSMADEGDGFSKKEEISAQNFVAGVKTRKLSQVIYLSGLMPQGKRSPHLESRLRVEEIIKSSGIPYTILRAGIIIGSGSASFEIIRDLVELLPVMIAPRWVSNRIQPIAIRDVLFYLAHVLGNRETLNHTFDIGGPDILTYKEMMEKFAKVRGLKRHIFTVPVLTPRLSSYWLYFVTSTNYSLAKNLVDSLKNEVICQENAIESILPHTTLTYEEAVEHAFSKIETHAVLSSWKDALHLTTLDPTLERYLEVPTYGCLSDEERIPLQIARSACIENLFSQGGERGWFMNWAWKLRGLLDKAVGGVGLRRGRTDMHDLNAGQSLDFWRVLVADREKGRLLLYAEMKLPGEAWLEWNVSEKELHQRATFRPKGVLGRLYWYLLYPLHCIIFLGMAKRLARNGVSLVGN